MLKKKWNDKKSSRCLHPGPCLPPASHLTAKHRHKVLIHSPFLHKGLARCLTFPPLRMMTPPGCRQHVQHWPPCSNITFPHSHHLPTQGPHLPLSCLLSLSHSLSLSLTPPLAPYTAHTAKPLAALARTISPSQPRQHS